MADLVLEHLHKTYGGGVPAVQDLNLSIDHGTFLCVLGPSGSGKSSVLKLIAGIEEATSGRILIDGVDITHLPPERRDVAMVFQSYALYPTMTVFGNIAFPLKIRKMARSDIERRVRDTAELLGIQDLLERRPRELSGGERQRVALGRAIVREPKVFLLDEPLSNLDANLRGQTRRELKRLHDLLGATFVYVTHDQDDALAMGNEVALLSQGRLEQLASTAAVYDTPANRFVASFIGRPPMNLFDGELVNNAGSLTFKGDLFSLPLNISADGWSDGQRITVGVRPEAVHINPTGAHQTVVGVVSDVAVIQPNVYVTAQIGSGSVLAQLAHHAEWPEHGEPVSLMIDPSELHVFDAETGSRVNQRVGTDVQTLEVK